MDNATNFDFQGLWQKIIDLGTTYGIKLILAVVVLIIGLMIIKSLVKGLTKILRKAEVIGGKAAHGDIIVFLEDAINFFYK